jgi:hypothetical protein
MPTEVPARIGRKSAGRASAGPVHLRLINLSIEPRIGRNPEGLVLVPASRAHELVDRNLKQRALCRSG